MGTGSFFKVKWLPGHVLVVVAVLVCLRLGWWQWDRTLESDGTLQNFGYAVLWPAFGASFIYMWWRFVLLEERREVSDDRELDGEFTDDDLAGLSEPVAAETDQDARTTPRPPADASVPQRDRRETAPADDVRADVTQPTADPDQFIGTVEDADEDEDPELAAYNRALAALAEEDRRRAG